MKKQTNGVGDKGKLKAKLIDELSVFWGLTIRRNKDSVKDMKTAIWATLKHKSSTDANPQHGSCPPRDDSWCTWQKAKAHGKLAQYSHKPALSDDVLSEITPVYEDLSSENLLQLSIGGFTQNNNENLNALIWSFAPKRVFSGAKTVKIASYLAQSIFNEGYESILKMMHIMNIIYGPNAVALCTEVDHTRISIADARSFEASKEGRVERRVVRSDLEETFYEAGGPLYEAGMVD